VTGSFAGDVRSTACAALPREANTAERCAEGTARTGVQARAGADQPQVLLNERALLAAAMTYVDHPLERAIEALPRLGISPALEGPAGKALMSAGNRATATSRHSAR